MAHPKNLKYSPLLQVIFPLIIVILGSPFSSAAEGQEESLENLFMKAQLDPALRQRFVDSYTLHKGLPEHVRRANYSEEMNMLALSSPLVQSENGEYRTTSHALAIGRGYPSQITFGPKLFHAAYNYADFESVLQHEAAHSKFWATGELNYMRKLGEDELQEVRLRGALIPLFKLDAIKTQMEHPT